MSKHSNGIVKKIKPSANGKHTGNKKPKLKAKAKVQSPKSIAPFSNYAGDIPLCIDDICGSLLELTGGWPKCISGVLCYAEDSEVRVLADTAALFAWIGSKSLVEWKRGARAVTKEEFFKRLHQRERWAWATPYPHFPPVPDVYYLSEPPKAKNTGKLVELVSRFCPKTDKDKELIKAFILTLFWGGPPGKRPQFVIAADEDMDEDAGRGSGKTTLVQYLSELAGGCIDIDASGDRGRICSNLLSPSSWGQRIVFIDNLKSTRFSNDFLEKLITRTEITGHRLYHGFATRPNLLTWAVTVNGAFFSTDMARRSYVIRLNRPSKKPKDWDAKTLAFIRENREAIIADIRWHLEIKEPSPLQEVDSWGSWCLAVLSRCKNPNTLLKHTGQQRVSIDADKEMVALALDHLRGCMITYFDEHENKAANVDNSIIWAPTAWLVQALQAFNSPFKERAAQLFLPRLAPSGRLVKRNTNTQRGYLWVGKFVDTDNPPPERIIVYRPDVPALRRMKK